MKRLCWYRDGKTEFEQEIHKLFDDKENREAYVIFQMFGYEPFARDGREIGGTLA